jgi:DNA-binding winged helix-turn-helix (wHTH) protein
MRLQFGEFVFDSALRLLTRSRETIELSPKAFAVLETLIEARPATVSREILYERLWPKTFVEPGNLDNLISEIRTALDDTEHALITTRRGVGYAFAQSQSSAVPPRYALIVGRDVFPLYDGENIVGRDPAAAIYIDSPDVSRRHARVTVHGDDVTIEDLGSKNGTRLGSEPLTAPRNIQEGDAIIIGRLRLAIRLLSGSTITRQR